MDGYVVSDGSSRLTRRGFLLVSCSGLVAGALSLTLKGCFSPRRDLDGSNNGRVPFNGEPQDKMPTDDELLNFKINKTIREMSLEHRVAQLFIVRPESLDGANATTQAGGQAREFLKRWPVGGVLYFAKNLINTTQTTSMLATTMQYALESNGIPPFLCVDEEGGTVSRIGGNSGFGVANVGDMAVVGASNDPERAANVAARIASYLKPLGFNVDFAPVCDIANNPNSNTMRQRAFGSSPEVVARMAAAQVEAFLESGMLCSAKHFPGIGSAVGDSHEARITSWQSIEELRKTELVPFVSAIDAGVPFVMAGHLSVPSITGGNIPASLSYDVIQKLLREELEYEGLIITDSLEMGAVDDYSQGDESAVLALTAGCDIVLLPANFEAAINRVLGAIQRGDISEDRINQSLYRILRTKFVAMGHLIPEG